MTFRSDNQHVMQRYIMFFYDKDMPPVQTEWMTESMFPVMPAVVVDTYNETYSTDGKTWDEMEPDHL